MYVGMEYQMLRLLKSLYETMKLGYEEVYIFLIDLFHENNVHIPSCECKNVLILKIEAVNPFCTHMTICIISIFILYLFWQL